MKVRGLLTNPAVLKEDEPNLHSINVCDFLSKLTVLPTVGTKKITVKLQITLILT